MAGRPIPRSVQDHHIPRSGLRAGCVPPGLLAGANGLLHRACGAGRRVRHHQAEHLAPHGTDVQHRRTRRRRTGAHEGAEGGRLLQVLRLHQHRSLPVDGHSAGRAGCLRLPGGLRLPGRHHGHRLRPVLPGAQALPGGRHHEGEGRQGGAYQRAARRRPEGHPGNARHLRLDHPLLGELRAVQHDLDYVRREQPQPLRPIRRTTPNHQPPPRHHPQPLLLLALLGLGRQEADGPWQVAAGLHAEDEGGVHAHGRLLPDAGSRRLHGDGELPPVLRVRDARYRLHDGRRDLCDGHRPGVGVQRGSSSPSVDPDRALPGHDFLRQSPGRNAHAALRGDGAGLLLPPDVGLHRGGSHHRGRPGTQLREEEAEGIPGQAHGGNQGDGRRRDDRLTSPRPGTDSDSLGPERRPPRVVPSGHDGGRAARNTRLDLQSN